MAHPPATGAAVDDASLADDDASEEADADSDAVEAAEELDDPDEVDDALVVLPAHPANATHAAIAPTSANTKNFFTMNSFPVSVLAILEVVMRWLTILEHISNNRTIHLPSTRCL